MDWALGASSAQSTSRAWSALAGDDGNRGGSQIQPDGVAAHHVFGLVIRHESRAPVARRSAGPLYRRPRREHWRPGAPGAGRI
jgi:hypothetical protein